MADLHVFLHTNVAPELAFRPPPRGSGFVAVHGWSSANVSAARQAFEQCCYRAPWALHAVHKYAWLLARSASMEMPSGAPMILADNDVLFQCTPSELISRFHSFGTPLVVGGERRWFPIPNGAHDPFGPRATLTWKQRYELRHHNQFYPNSGLIMGTAHGFHALQRAMHERNERFPCCAFEGEQGGFTLDPCTSCKPPRTFEKPAPCIVDDQACMHVALARTSRLSTGDLAGRGGRPTRHPPRHAVDTESRLFLNLGDLSAGDLAIRGGRLAFKHSPHVPCAVHTNGFKGMLQRLAPLLNASRITWFVQPPLTEHVARSTVRAEWLSERMRIEGMTIPPQLRARGAQGSRAHRHRSASNKGQ